MFLTILYIKTSIVYSLLNVKMIKPFPLKSRTKQMPTINIVLKVLASVI